MNYFAHAIRHLDRPAFLAGLALPDWLSVVDRKVRLRAKHIEAQRGELDTEQNEIADGILQHLEDDRWFHGTEGFYQVTAQVGAAFRKVLGEEETWRCGFLGHIVSELLLDSVLIEHRPELLDEYYAVMNSWNPHQIEAVVNLVGTQPTTNVVRFVELFIAERFLFDYQDDTTLLRRLNQVMRRVSLTPLPAECREALQEGREHVRNGLHALLPWEHFPELITLIGNQS